MRQEPFFCRGKSKRGSPVRHAPLHTARDDRDLQPQQQPVVGKESVRGQFALSRCMTKIMTEMSKKHPARI